MVKKAKFTPEQAAQLTAAVAATPEHTVRRWVHVAALVAGGKDANQCRAHWLEVLEPKALGLKVGGWSAAEDELLQLEVHQILCRSCLLLSGRQTEKRAA